MLAGIPEDVAEYLAAIQVRVEEELAFIDSSSIYGRIVAVGASWHQDASSGGRGGVLWGGVVSSLVALHVAAGSALLIMCLRESESAMLRLLL